MNRIESLKDTIQMVQIMNGSGHCSRNRAERASLEGKPEYPDGTESSVPNQISDLLQPTVLQTPDVITPAIVIADEEEYEAYGQNGTQDSAQRKPDETNNNLSDSEKDWGFIVESVAWAATSSLHPPRFDDEDEPHKSDSLGMPILEVVNTTQIHSDTHFPVAATAGGRKYSKSVVSPKRRRRKSKGSTCSSGSTISRRSTNSLQSQRPKTCAIETRRRSTQSAYGSRKRRMDIDVAPLVENILRVEPECKKLSAECGTEPVVADIKSIIETPSTSAAVPYCYRCYLKFAKYSHWKKHAIYEHILAKNPYPIVEMNYIDPASLGIVVTPNTEEEEERSAFDEENAFIDETTLGDTCIASESTSHGRLRLCIGKEKGGAYVVKEKKSLSHNILDNSDDCPPVLEAPSPNHSHSFQDPSSPDLVMPMLKPCPALTTSQQNQQPPQSEIIKQKFMPDEAPCITDIFSNTPPTAPLETADLEARYRRMVSIESELETVLNIDMEEDFETALEFATERSRVAAGITENAIPGGIGSSGGIVVPFSTNPVPSSITMISEEVPNPSPAIAIVSETQKQGESSEREIAQDAPTPTEGESRPNSLLNKLLNSKTPPRYPNLVKANKNENSNDSSSSSGKDSENSDENVVGEKNNSSCDTLQNVQSTEKVGETISDKIDQSNKEIEQNVEKTVTENSGTRNEKSNVPDKEAGESHQSNQITPPPETEGNDGDGDGESDALQCRVCQKVFMSDDELNEHFSQDHFRLAGGMGILEPESPYPPPQTPQQPSFFSGEDDEPTRGSGRPYENTLQPQQQPQITVARSFVANASNSSLQGRNGPPNPMSQPQPQPQPNLARRPSNDNGMPIHHPSYTAQEELQNIMWRNQVNAAAALNAVHAQQQRNQGAGGVPRGFPAMSPLHPGNPRPIGSHRMSPPNMTVGGMPSRAPGPSNNQQPMPRQQQQQQQPSIHYSNSSIRPPQYGPGQQPQRLPIPTVQSHQRGSPPQYPMSLHNALTMGAPHYSQASIRPVGNMVQQQQSGGGNRPPPPGASLRQIQPNPYQQQQQQQQNVIRGGMPSIRAQPVPLGQTIGMNQQMLNQMNAQRELNSQFQQRLAQPHPSMPRLQQGPQQRIVHAYPHQQQQPRPSPLSQKRPAPQGPMSCIEISELRSNKEPRMEISQNPTTQSLQQQRSVVRPPETNRPVVTNNANSSPGPINQNVSAAIGSVGNAGINSVRLGNSITLSVCPTSSSANSSPATSPALRDQTSGSIRQSHSSGSSTGTVSPAGMSSVLAVRGVTVTPASPPITAISPVSSPSPCNSPAAPSPGVYSSHQQIHHHFPQAASVIQRGPGSISPENPRDKNFSPPVITTVRGNAHPLPNNSHSPSSSHNFAIPRPPPPIQRGGMVQGPPFHHPSSYSVNSSADRPERPPTVDLTDDDVQAHHVSQQVSQQAQQRMNGYINHQQQQQQTQQNPSIRRFVTAQTANFPQSSSQQPRPLTARLPSCNICGLMFPSIQSLEQHKLQNHNVARTNPQGVPTAISPSAGGGPRPQMSSAAGGQMQSQPQQPQPPSTTMRSMVISRQPLNPGQVAHQRPPPAPVSNSLLRHHQPDASQIQIRSQSPNRPAIPNSPIGKYLYIPLLDLGRLDANKMRKLEEIGISCVVPLQGNNAMTSMGIPVMSLRGEGAVLGQHVPWDSVLPMGPVHTPIHQPVATQQENNRDNNPNNNNANNTRNH